MCIGGGTGVSTILSGFKEYPVDLTAIVTMFDNGGSSGRLREELGILPVGDLRQCLVSLSQKNDLIDIFNYRLNKGNLKGHNLGNLLIAAASQIEGSLEKGVKKIGSILNIKGEILGITLGNANIIAVLENGHKIKGEENIVNCRNLSKTGVKKLFLNPEVKANPKVLSAIKNADLIIIGPGKFYTSILANFLVKDISEAVRKSCAKKFFICNLMTQRGNTDNFKVEDFVATLEKYLGKNIIDYVIFNTGRLSSDLFAEVKKDFPGSDYTEYDPTLLKNDKFIGRDVLNENITKSNPFDTLVKGANKRTMVLHDTNKLAKIIINLCKR